MKKEKLDEYLKSIQEDWPSPFVARCKIHEFTKGMYKPNTLNSYDSTKNGISRKYKLNERIFYKVEDVISWLKNKLGE